MTALIITTEDLLKFKIDLLEEIKKIIESQTTVETQKWLRSPEVRKLLNISTGTLHNLRSTGTLSYTKIGGTIYYSCQDINNLLEKNKVIAFSNPFK
ncbi:Helix-turn-helix domain protein [compost metagenome]